MSIKRVNKTECHVFNAQGKFVGRIDYVRNWGRDYLARPANGKNAFFANRKDAATYLGE